LVLACPEQGHVALSKISIIVPTYNERENLSVLAARIHDSLPSLDYEIIIVDDNSPNGTGALADELAQEKPIKVVHRQGKLGLASAVLEGFRQSEGEFLIVMDADLSHPPSVLPHMVKALKTHDLVVGSRYVKGGSSEDSRIRKVLSRGACILAMPLTPVKDLTSGFFGIRKSCLNGAMLCPIGYKVGLECFVKANIMNYTEVPLPFSPRNSGKSKLSFSIITDYLRQLISLYLYKLGRMIKFGVAEALGTVIVLLGTFLLVELANLHYMLSVVLATLVGFVMKYYVNSIWTFASAKASNDAEYEWNAWHKGNPIQKWWKRSIARKTRKLTGNPSKLLDLACGSSPNINQFDCECIGIDSNQGKIEFMRQHSPHQFLCQDILAINYQDEFDAIICNEVIEHLPMPEGEILAQKISAALKEGGKAIVATPDYSSFIWKFIEKVYDFFYPQAYAQEHVSHYTEESLTHLFEKHGFRKLKAEKVLGCDLVICFEKK